MPETSPVLAPSIGEGTVLLGRYMLMRKIGQGGTSEVYRVRDLLAVLGGDEQESHVAIKVVRTASAAASLETDGADSQLMLREALATRHLAHPNILKVYDFHRDGDICFVAMELIDGESLADFLNRLPNKKMPYRQVLSIVNAVSAALQYAHDQGVIHSDIKPSNILMTENGEIKVIDFATARSYMDARVKGQKFGHDPKFYGYTLAYASPQTIADEPAKPSDDVFSFACIIYEMLAGKHPYGRKPTNTIPKDFKLVKPQDVSAAQWWVLRRALSLDAAVRFATVREFTRRFVSAGKVWRYAASLALLAVFGVWSGSYAYQNVGTYIDNEGLEKSAQAAVSTSANLVQDIQSLPLATRLDKLSELTALEPSQHKTVLALLQDDIINQLSEETQRTLSYSLLDNEFPDFSVIAKQLDTALASYPDSYALIQAKQAIAAESEQLLGALLIQFRDAWQSAEFTVGEGKSIAAMVASMRQLNRDITLAPDTSVVTRYDEKIAAAVAENKVQIIYELHEFAQLVNAIPEFVNTWKNYDAGLPIAAKSLIDYQLSGQPNAEYPEHALRLFVEPYFATLNTDIANLWLDKDIFAVNDRLEDAKIHFGLPDDLPILQSTVKTFMTKVTNKIAYHQQKGNVRSLTQLQIMFDDMQVAAIDRAGVNTPAVRKN